MKICFLGDLHFGVRSDSIEFHKYFEHFFTFVFFPYLQKHKITTVIQFGDFFDSRKNINLQTLHLVTQYFLNKLLEYNITLHIIIGNHCSYFKNSLHINSPELLLKKHEKIIVHSDFTQLNLAGKLFDIIPWICADNKEFLLNTIKNSTSKYCLGHFEIAGGKFDAINVCHEGIPLSLLSNYKQVFSGHFHTQSKYGNVKYLGTPYQLTWIDYEDIKGFYIFDTDTEELEFIKNHLKIFNKIKYDDSVQDISHWETGVDLSYLKDCYVKLLVISKTNQYLFDTVVAKIEAVGVLELSIVENLIEVAKMNESCSVDEAANTLELLHNYIDSQELNVNNNKLKTLMNEIYTEAINLNG